jgi:hypothetical protein
MIKYSSFCDAFAPKDERYLKELAARVPRNIQLTTPYQRMFTDRTK